MKIKFEKSCRYAQPDAPHLPIIEFVEGSIVDVVAKLAESIIGNEHGFAVPDDTSERTVIEPKSKEEGVEVESKDDASMITSDEGEDASSVSEAPRKRRGRPPKNPQ